jgi:histidine ammonia-lyase
MTALRIGDEPLTPAALVAAARSRGLEVRLSAAARERMAAARRTVEAEAERRPIYGLTTGVGANRDVAIEDLDMRAHSVRLLRSHAGGVGDPLPDELVRGTILVRLAQMAAGGGGQRPEIADALAAVLGAGALPVLRDLGGIGTGDLTLLAQLALALAGEGEWTGERGSAPDIAIEAGDALAFMSSNAATFAAAALAWADLSELLDAGLGVAALTFRALDGNGEAFAAPIAAARPLPGLTAASERLRALIADGFEPARVQDPFGLRCLPPVAGALHDAAAALHDVLAIEIGAAAENPLIADGEVLHHGGFHAAPCALALDALRLALVPFASLSAARLAHLMEPRLSGLPAFLAPDAPGSSGVLIAEYLAADALARLRAAAVPAVLGSVAISRGLEEHASFAWQAAGQARNAVFHMRTVLALEWVVAERALRMKGVAPAGALVPIRALAAGFDARLDDRPMGEDTALAQTALPALARAVRSAAGEAAARRGG